MCQHEGERKASNDYSGREETAEVDRSRAFVVGGEVITSAVRKEGVGERCQNKNESLLYLLSSVVLHDNAIATHRRAEAANSTTERMTG